MYYCVITYLALIMKQVIINRGHKYSTVNGVIVLTETAQTLVNIAIKSGKAKLLVDSETTLMYSIN